MSSLSEFLGQIAEEMGRPRAAVESVVAKLEDAWYDSVDSLKEIPDDKWSELGVPARLADRIKKKLHGDKGASNESPRSKGGADLVLTAPKQEAAPSPTTQTRSSGEFEVDLAPPHNETLDVPLESLLQTGLENDGLLGSERLSELRESLATMFKLVDGVLSSPHDERKKKIRLANPAIAKKIGCFRGILAFLNCVGFQNESEGGEKFLICRRAYLSRLNDAHQALARVVVSLGGAPPPLPPSFNPYQASYSSAEPSLNGVGNASVQQAAQKNAQAIREQLEAATKKMEDAARKMEPVPLHPQVFSSEAVSGSLDNVLRQLEEEHLARLGDADAELLLEQLAKMSAAVDKSSSFRSRESEDVKKLVQKKVHSTAVMRVVLPDKVVLQLNFRAFEKLSDVQKAVESCLLPMWKGQWYLFQTPPFTKLNLNKKGTLSSEGLVPGAVLRLGVEGKNLNELCSSNLLSSELQSSLPQSSSPPAATSSGGRALPSGSFAAPVQMREGFKRKKDEAPLE